MLNEKVKRKAAEKQASYLEKEKKWFKPSIGKAEQVSLKRKPVSRIVIFLRFGAIPALTSFSSQENAKENIEQRVERLSIQVSEKK